MHTAQLLHLALKALKTGTARYGVLHACATLALSSTASVTALAAPAEVSAARSIESIVADAPTALAPLGGEASAVRFRVSVGGNRPETFLSSGGIEGNGAVAGIAAGEDETGAFDPAIDRRLATTQHPIAAGAVKALLVIVGGTQQIPMITLSARAATGRGTSGAPFAGRGEGGGEAVVGSTYATAGVVPTNIL